MGQRTKDSPISLPNSSALSRFRRVVIASAVLAYAGVNQRCLGVLETATQTTDAQAAVSTRNAPGTLIMVASGAITKYADVYAAANGKVAGSGVIKEGIALEAATADGDEIEVLITNSARLEPLYTAIAASTAISNTTSETLFDSQYSIPANTLKAGDRLRIRYQGIATATNSTDTLAIKLYIGGLSGTVLISHAATDVADNNVFTGEIELVVRTVGASGTFVGVGTYKSVPAAAGTMTVKDAVVASTAIDTTAAQVVGLSATWSVATASNSVRLDILNVDRLSA